ncbi:MAG: KOW domain-containing RNA-binding protein [Clostridia bacterium]|nr:KOW domain-containing RNA-binding protein [Clostridia bacterium]
MQFVKGMVVRSKAGHDKGSFFVVLKVENDIAYIIDGKNRNTQKPKKKKLMHLSPTSTVLDEQSMGTDSEILKTLSTFNSKVQSFI